MDLQRLLERMGLDSPKWRWRAYRWEQRLQGLREDLRGTEGGVPMASACPHCGALSPADAGACPSCGRRLLPPFARRLRRVFALVVPGRCPASTLILAANVAVAVLVLVLYGPRELFQPGREVLYRFGALVPALVRAGRYEQLITYGFLHIGLVHLLFNLFALSRVGPMVEGEIGRARFFVVYLLTLVAGGAADVLLRGAAMVFVAGASGALFGLIGFGVAYGHLYGGYAGHAQRNFFAHWAVYGFLFGMLVGADHIAHGGGFLAGAALAAAVHAERRVRDRTEPLWRAAAAGLLALTVLAYAVLVWRNLA